MVLLAAGALAASAGDWRQRTIYQLLTDRFARGNGDNSPCGDIRNYCGGTFKGIESQLDYIAGMGFDAIWISPVVANTPGGYHGYWAQDLYSINSNFGTAQDLKDLVTACHNKGIWVMADVVCNHVGPVGYDYSTIKPFNDASDYHNCNSCPPGCSINFGSSDQNQVELCRLAGLPDLNQSNPFVANTLVSWAQQLISTYEFDGLRIDTVPEVSKTFWTQFSQGTGAFAIGEVFDGRVDYVAGYQGPVSSVLSYPLYFTITNVFARQQSMRQIESTLSAYNTYFKDTSVLGTFLENHDNPRFKNMQGDNTLYKAALTFSLMARGIPIIYYGAAQGFNGGADPNNREPLWTTNFNTNTELYKYISSVINIRKSKNIQALDQVQRYADDQFYAFTRGTEVFVATTNVGSNGPQIVRQITYQPFADGTKLCNLLFSGDCITVTKGSFTVYLNNGETKIFAPA
uniref:alpha-amylase n=1 Tax=Arcella intermedia TaxID=1963864 RepID=A0A6B2L3N6_9EUKA